MAVIGVTEHGNSAVLVTVANGAMIDRRRVDLTHGLPTHPYHHEGAWAVGRYVDRPWAKPTSLPEAIALIERVHVAAAGGAKQALDALATTLPEPVTAIAIRFCPDLPTTIEARIRDVRANTMADSVMYRRALGEAAAARGWAVAWYDRDTVFDRASARLGVDVQPFLAAMGKAAGAPWQAAHKLAAAAAIAATA